MIITTSNNNKFKVVTKKTKLYWLVNMYERFRKKSFDYEKVLTDQCRFELLDYESTRNQSGLFYVKPAEFQHLKGMFGTITVISDRKFYSVENFGIEEEHEFSNRNKPKIAKAMKILVREMNDFEVLMLEPEVIRAPRSDDGVSVIMAL
jgi:hypothetical protein